VSWFSNVFGKSDEVSRSAGVLAAELNRQRTMWLDAVSVDCRSGDAVIGIRPSHGQPLLAPSAITSAFQAVHVSSLVYANKYVLARDMTRFTTALCTALTNGDVTDAWKRALVQYTDLKRKPVHEQVAVFAEDIATSVTGSTVSGMLIGPGLVWSASEFLHRNHGIAAHSFGDEATTQEMADAVRRMHDDNEEITVSDRPSIVPEWLEDKSGNAPTLWRVVMDATELRLRRDYPHVLASTSWSSFNHMAVVGGCVALALELHAAVSEEYRTPLERTMRAALSPGVPAGEAAYEHCVRTVRETLLDLPRADRRAARHVLIAMWVFRAVGSDDSVVKNAHLVAELAQVYLNETSAYWLCA
jgi:hypothetical protein